MHATVGQDGQEQQPTLFGNGPGAPSSADILASQRQLAYVFDASPSAVARWPLHPVRRIGREALFSVRDAVRHRLATDGRPDLGRERARLASAQADKAQLDNAERARRLIPVELVLDIVGGQVSIAKNMLLAMGSKIVFELCSIAGAPPADRHKFADLIDREVRFVLEELSAERAADALELPAPAGVDDAALDVGADEHADLPALTPEPLPAGKRHRSTKRGSADV